MANEIIKNENLKKQIIVLLHDASNVDKSLYINSEGRYDVRNTSEDLGDWDLVLAGGISDVTDNNNNYPDNEKFDFDGVAEWIMEEWL